MKKYLRFVVALVLCIVALAGCANPGIAAEAAPADSAQAASNTPMPAVAPSAPTQSQIVALFPNAAKVDGVGVYLLWAKDFGVGPSYTISKVAGLVNIDAQFAAMSKGGSYIGWAAEVTVVDVLDKLGKKPGSMVINFNPSFGLTAGYRTGVATKSSGLDGGIRLNILNVDMSKVSGLLGL